MKLTKIFFKHIVIALIIIFLLVFLTLKMISYSTNHGQEITVPDLSMMTVEEAVEKLEKTKLSHILLDTLEYNEDFPKYSIVVQDPKAGSKVKEGRKVYLKINAESYRHVTLPDLIQKTIRQAGPTLRVLGLEVGTITYQPHLGKDMVLEMRINGKKANPGDNVMKTTKIDLVLGDGKIGFEELDSNILEQTDSDDDF
ncbi:MAG: PASTA domain-containing protein [Flavobacteriaceae bacterium]|jgi:beta-lactam-binding protein with PASTA domain|nr:PASTA domain-containing protein [Flavobacteriaceae bacterium]